MGVTLTHKVNRDDGSSLLLGVVEEGMMSPFYLSIGLRNTGSDSVWGFSFKARHWDQFSCLDLQNSGSARVEGESGGRVIGTVRNEGLEFAVQNEGEAASHSIVLSANEIAEVESLLHEALGMLPENYPVDDAV